jgi:hypothetical protein
VRTSSHLRSQSKLNNKKSNVMFEKKLAEVPFWWVLASLGAALALVLVYSMLTVENVVSSNEGTFVKKSFLKPLSKEEANKVAADHEKQVAASSKPKSN